MRVKKRYLFSGRGKKIDEPSGTVILSCRRGVPSFYALSRPAQSSFAEFIVLDFVPSSYQFLPPKSPVLRRPFSPALCTPIVRVALIFGAILEVFGSYHPAAP